jgi:hypothetical protein
LDIRPHLTSGDVGTVSTFLDVLQRQGRVSHPHWVADAAFGSVAMVKDIQEWDAIGTLSCSSNQQGWLWNVLSYQLPPRHWRVAYHSELDIIASCHAVTDDNGKKHYQQLLSSGWKVVSREQQQPQPLLAVPTTMPKFQREDLQGMKLPQLRQICKTYNIKQGKKKAGYVENICQCSESVHHHSHQVDAILRSISSEAISDPAPPHDFYKEWFNLIDLADRRWYAVEETHHHQKWETKMILAILCIAVMNTWVYVTKMEYKKWKVWRKALLRELIHIA